MNKVPAKPLNEKDLARLEELLDAVPAPLEPLDVSMLDGFLTGVLLQPKAVSNHLWTPYVLDAEEGRKPPDGFDAKPLLELVKRRYQELNAAIAGRQWFDPLVFELEDTDNPSEILLPWVAGFALATEIFPDLMRQDAASLLEPLASIFMHLDPEDLEDADELLEEIESLEPPKDLEEAVEGVVSACLMLADVTRPLKEAPSSGKQPRRVQPKPRRH
ncbi:MAG: YecA family protein [Paucibacter sp.]|nr:YecA family protein [Roseateles sp.]